MSAQYPCRSFHPTRQPLWQEILCCLALFNPIGIVGVLSSCGVGGGLFCYAVSRCDDWFAMDNVIAAELGPASNPPSAADVSVRVGFDQAQALPPTSDAPVEAEAKPLVPLASELANDQVVVLPEIWDVPYGTPTRLMIPVIALDSRVVPVGQTPIVLDGVVYRKWNTADDAVGWHNLSARLGHAGNTVLTGHSDVNAAVFRYLEYLAIGDEITVFSGDRDCRYVVTDKFLVRERHVSLAERIQNASWVAATWDERLTLVTFANLGATHRLILIARPQLPRG